MRNHIIGVGHSHLSVVREAFQEECLERHERGLPRKHEIDFQHIGHFRDDLGNTVRKTWTSLPDNVTAAAAQAKQNLEGIQPVFLLSLMGGEYFFFGTAVHPRKYDFVLPERPDLLPSADAEIISSVLVKSALRLESDCAMDFIAFLKSKYDFPCYFYACPPPVRDSAYLARVGHMRQLLEKHGVSTPEFRLKLWLMQDSMYREGCESLGVVYIDPPEQTKDQDGFLRPEYWKEDGFHGNIEYGRVQLRHLMDTINTSGQ